MTSRGVFGQTARPSPSAPLRGLPLEGKGLRLRSSPIYLAAMTEPPADPALILMAAIVRSLTEHLAQQPSLVGLDVADIRACLKDGGRAAFGQAEAEGQDRALHAANGAIRDLKRSVRAGVFES